MKKRGLENKAEGITWDMSEISLPLQSGHWEETLETAEKMAGLLAKSLKGKFLDAKIVPQQVILLRFNIEIRKSICEFSVV